MSPNEAARVTFSNFPQHRTLLNARNQTASDVSDRHTHRPRTTTDPRAVPGGKKIGRNRIPWSRRPVESRAVSRTFYSVVVPRSHTEWPAAGIEPAADWTAPVHPVGPFPIIESVGFLSRNHLSRPGPPSAVVKRQPLAG